MEFAYDGGGIAKGGAVTLYFDGNPCGTGRVEQTEPFSFSVDETLDLGSESGSPVTRDYGQRKFNGEVRWVEIEIGLDDHSHLLKAEDRWNLVMATH
jgi:arylsulfatase